MSVSDLDLSFLHPPCRLQILWKTTGGEQAAYSGQLRGVSDEHLEVHLLGYGLVPCALRTGESVSLHVPVDHGVYEIPSRVLSEDISGDLQIEITGKVKRLDRRKYPRVRVSMAATTAFLPGARSQPPAPITVRVVELSGGGIKLESFAPLEPDQPLQIVIPIPGHAPIFPSGIVREVIRPIRTGATTGADRYMVRVEFTTILQSERRIMLRYIAREKEQVS